MHKMIVPFAALGNIPQPTEESPIAIKVAVLVHTSVIPPLPPNTMNKTIVLIAVRGHMRRIVAHLIAQFVVPVNIRRTPEETPIAIKVAVLAHTSVIPPLPPNTMSKTIVLIAVLEHMHRILVHLIAQFVVRANIRRTTEESPIAIKVAVLAHTSVIPPLPPNTMSKTIVPFAVLVNIQSLLEEQTIAIFVLPAHTSLIPPPQPNTIKKTIVPFAALENIPQPTEEPPIVIKVAVLAHTSVIPPPQLNMMGKTIVSFAKKQHFPA